MRIDEQHLAFILQPGREVRLDVAAQVEIQSKV